MIFKAPTEVYVFPDLQRYNGTYYLMGESACSVKCDVLVREGECILYEECEKMLDSSRMMRCMEKVVYSRNVIQQKYNLKL